MGLRNDPGPYPLWVKALVWAGAFGLSAVVWHAVSDVAALVLR